MKRHFILAVLCGILALCSSHVRGQTGNVAGDGDQPSAPYDAVGRLMRNREADTSRRSAPLVLVDKDGKARCYVISRAGSDLSDLLSQRVGVRGSVRFMDGDTLPLILAQSVQAVGDPVAQPANQSDLAVTKHPVRQAAHARREAQPQEPTLAQPKPSEPTLAEAPTPGPEVDELLMVQPEVEELPALQPVDGPAPIESFPGDSFPIEVPDDFSSSEPDLFEGLNAECESCGGTSCTTGSPCCLANDPGHWFVRAEYLMWSTKGMYIPPLATTGPGASNPGILGEPGTVILFGDEAINGDMRSGARISLGTWLDQGQTWGLSGEYFGLEDANESFFATSNASGVPTISRPYFTVYGLDAMGDLKPPGENAELVALEGVLAGSLRVTSDTSFQGGGVFLRHTFCCKNRCWKSCDKRHSSCTTSCCDDGDASSGIPGGVRVGMFGGYRFMQLGDGVSITEDLTAISTAPVDQGQFLINDNFRSNNQFNGGELGFVTEARRARWTVELLSRLALGNNRQTVQIDGSTVITDSLTDDGTYEGGLLALPTNIGSYTRDQFSVIPQINANLGYNLTPRLRAIVGYTFIYWGNVARAGEQISLDVNETYIPAGFVTPEGPRRPAFAWQSSDFWAQGLNVGLDYFW
jgi:hypothetical protein